MRRVIRAALPGRVQAYLDRRQAAVDQHRQRGTLDIGREWKAARQTQAIREVLRSLQQMMGERGRCMYCVDSHGSDIDHFRPKKRYPQRAFRWANMLLCCTECGRFKGDQFPLSNGRPMLIDPTAEDPWGHLDFDPDTGNLTARFDLEANGWSARGEETVKVLQLDRREDMAAGYAATFRRLSGVVQASLASLANGATTASVLLAELREADDHGLLPWCLNGSGRNLTPFSQLREQFPQVWADCLAVLQ